MIYVLIAVAALVAYFVHHARSIGYKLRSVQKHSIEVQKTINTMATVAAPTGEKLGAVPHIQDAQRNLNRILSKYSNDKVISISAIRDFRHYLDASVLQTQNRIKIGRQVTSFQDVPDMMKQCESDDSSYALDQVRKRQQELLGDEYIKTVET